MSVKRRLSPLAHKRSKTSIRLRKRTEQKLQRKLHFLAHYGAVCANGRSKTCNENCIFLAIFRARKIACLSLSLFLSLSGGGDGDDDDDDDDDSDGDDDDDDDEDDEGGGGSGGDGGGGGGGDDERDAR